MATNIPFDGTCESTARIFKKRKVVKVLNFKFVICSRRLNINFSLRYKYYHSKGANQFVDFIQLHNSFKTISLT